MKKKADKLVFADHLVTMGNGDNGANGDNGDEALGVIDSGGLAIVGDRIEAVGTRIEIEEAYESLEVIEGDNAALIPGLYNTHTHAAMALLRGLSDDVPLKIWLEDHIWPAENKWLSEEFVRDGVRLACLEMLLAGTVGFADMYFFDEVAGEVSKEFGMRAQLFSGVIDFPTKTTSGSDQCIDNARELYERFKNDELIQPAIGAHSAYTCSPETLRKIYSLAKEKNMPFNIHLSETKWEVDEIKQKYGLTPVRHLEKLGFLDKELRAAHCVWVDKEEIEMLAKREVKVAHCVESNLKLASGIAPVPDMLRAGISVSLGTDGAASNNDLDIFGEMRTAALVHKGASNDPECMDAYTVLKMATVNGASAFGLEGTLTPGAHADMVMVSTAGAHMNPVYNICSQIIYSAKSSDVKMVIINGNTLVSDGRVLNADQDEIIDKARYWGTQVKSSRN
jgi:5-methylthioadenosine/S-adenosylhomocysteine deaminase